MITWILLFIIIALTVQYLLSHYNRLHRIIDLIPGPKSWFLLGNFTDFPSAQDELWNVVRKFGDIYYPIYRLWAGTIPMVHIRHPDDVEIVLGNPQFITKSIAYTFFEPWFGKGLITSSDAKWQKRKKIIAPAFHFNILQQFVEIFIEEGEQLTNFLKKEGVPVVTDLMPLISEHTVNLLCETALGTSVQSKGEFTQKYIKAVHDASHLVVYRIIRPWLYPNFMFELSPAGRRQNKLLETIRGYIKTILSERKVYHDQTGGRYLTRFDKENANGEEENENDLGIRKKRLALLDLLLSEQRKNAIDDEGILEEVTTFMAAGFHTSMLCVCFTIMLLAEHKEIQVTLELYRLNQICFEERARAEVNAVLDENDGKMSLLAVQRLPYLERCIKESLRLYPIVHSVSRKLDRTVRLSNYEVPKGTMIHVHIANVHRDPNFWPKPEIFDPDRFSPDKNRGRHPFSYIPFGAGPRLCIGQRFAMLEIKAFIGIVLRNFYLEPIDYLKDLQLNCDITIQPAHPIRTKFIPIKDGTKDTKST